MPPLPPVAGVVKIRWVGQNNGRPWNNILHAKFSGPAPSVADLTTYANQHATQWANNIASLCFTNTSLTAVQVVDLSSATSNSAEVTTSQAGTRAGPSSLPVNVAMVASENISLRYRGGHPRIYLPAGTNVDVIQGHLWTTTFIAEANAGLGSMLTALNATPIGTGASFLCAVSYRTAHTLRPTPLPFAVNSFIVHPRVDTQRRRLGKEIP